MSPPAFPSRRRRSPYGGSRASTGMEAGIIAARPHTVIKAEGRCISSAILEPEGVRWGSVVVLALLAPDGSHQLLISLSHVCLSKQSIGIDKPAFLVHSEY